MAGVVHATASPAWANSAAADTAVNVDVAEQERLTPGEHHAITIVNPSAVTALTVTVHAREEVGGADVYGAFVPAGDTAPLSLAVPVGATRTFVVASWLGHGGRLTLSNDTALGASDGFTADVVVREIG